MFNFMLSIFICDDNKVHLDALYDYISLHINSEEYDAKIVMCSVNPNDVIDFIGKNNVNGLYFLDIDLGQDIDGVELAKEIRRYDPRGFIVFISSHEDRAATMFKLKVEPLDYIYKSFDRKMNVHIFDCIKYAYKKHISRKDKESFTFKEIGESYISCEYDDILFFETDVENNKRLVLHTKKRQYIFYNSLKEVAKILPDGLFCLCHKSTIVNVKNISANNINELKQKKGYITMVNGAECEVSSRNRAALIKVAEIISDESRGSRGGC